MNANPIILPCGDRAVLVEFGKVIDPAIQQAVHSLFQRAQQGKIRGITELVPSYCSLLVGFDPFFLSPAEVSSWLRKILERNPPPRILPLPIREIPVVYGGRYGPDIATVAGTNRRSVEEVIRLHTGREYLVYVIGGFPGLGAMGIVDPRIETPRLTTPRIRVPAGSVAIAGKQTGIYAIESPGGWQLIGRTPLRLFDPNREPPSFFQAGEKVRFVAISEGDFLGWKYE